MFKSNTCSRQVLGCSDFKNADEYNVFDELNSEIKICAYDHKAEECKEVSQSCFSYNRDVSSVADRKNKTCYAIAVYNTSTKEFDFSQVCLIEKDDDTKACKEKKFQIRRLWFCLF